MMGAGPLSGWLSSSNFMKTGFLVLANASDEAALRVAVMLRQRHHERVQVCTPEEIVLAHWEHRISFSGVENKIRLHSGAFLEDADHTVVFNRLAGINVPLFAGASMANQDYARTETFALLLSWLANPRYRVVNRPSPSNLSGPAYSPMIWQNLALRAGLQGLDVGATTSIRRFPLARDTMLRPDIGWVRDPYGQQPNSGFSWYSAAIPEQRTSVLVIGERVIGDVPDRVAGACQRLATLAQVDLLRIDFARPEDSPANFVFIGADPTPAVIECGALIALVEFLESVSKPDHDGAVE